MVALSNETTVIENKFLFFHLNHLKVMKKNFFTLIMVVILTCISTFSPNSLNADCISCDGYLDNGFCDKRDINNKFCVIGSPFDCYRHSCNPSPPIQ